MKSVPSKVIESDFLRGALISGMNSSVQKKKNNKKMIKQALQSGIALASGMQFSRAFEQSRYSSAALYAALGLVGVLLTEEIFQDEEEHGKEDKK